MSQSLDRIMISLLFLMNTDTQILNNAISFTAKTYHDIGQIHAEQVHINS